MNKETALMKGIRTAIQTIVAFVTVIWAVPGVPEATTQFAKQNIAALGAAVGVGSGVVAFVWNFFRKDVQNF